jgi:phenylacetate-CoA ligase
VLSQAAVVADGRVVLEKFRNIPFLTREDLVKNFESLKSEDLHSRVWFRNSTGGSSGEPVAFLQDEGYEIIGLATMELQYRWAGKRPGEPFVRLWGSDRDVLQGTLEWRRNVGNFVRNRAILNSFCMSRPRMDKYIHTLKRMQPVMIEAYAESIYELARYMNSSGIKLSSVRAVVSGAGTLFPFITSEVDLAFGCPTLNRYGSREVGGVAGERSAGGGLEVFSYTNFVEIIDNEGRTCGPGEEGEVVVTCLSNFAMPIIRYRIGDRATVGEASLWPTPSVERLQSVTGRTMDAFIREDGSTVPGIFFSHFIGVVHNAGWVKKTQVIQTDYDSVLVKLVLTAPVPSGALDEIRRSLRLVMSTSCKVEFEFVDEIPPSPSGKYRYTISLAPRSDPQMKNVEQSVSGLS